MNTPYANVSGRAAWAPVTVCLAILLALSVPASAIAQPQCGQGQGRGGDISACTGEILNEQDRTIELLDQMNQQMGAMGLVQPEQMQATDRQLEFIRNNHDRGRREKDDTTTDEFDAVVVKGTPSECTFRLLPRFAMGPPPRPVCSDEEIAANRCEEVCEFSQSEKDRNTQRGLRLEDSLADALEQNKRANDELDTGLNTLAMMSLQTFSTAEDACPFDNPHPNLAPFTPGYLVAINQIHNVNATLAAVGKDVCQQDAAGFNASTACIVFSVLEGTSRAIDGLVTTVDGNFTSAKVDATFECVRQLQTASGDQQAQLDDLERRLDEVKVLLEEVKVLLSTPQGQREGFPAK